MRQVLGNRGHGNLVVVTGTVDDLPIEARHLAANHGHRAPGLRHGIADANCGS